MTGLPPLGIAALALLAERPMHPYEMYQVLIHRREDRNVKVRPGSLYHAVDKLEEHGLVTATGVEREGNRPERTSYAITDAGRDMLLSKIVSMLSTPADEYPEFPLAIANAFMLPAEQVVDLLGQRRERIAEQVASLEAAGRAVQSIELPARFWLDANFQLAMLRAKLAWLDATIPDIADGTIDWSSPIPSNLKDTIA